MIEKENDTKKNDQLIAIVENFDKEINRLSKIIKKAYQHVESNYQDEILISILKQGIDEYDKKK